MKKVKVLIIAVTTFTLLTMISNSYADYTYSKPNVILLDKDKNPVVNVTKSTDYARCLQKANSQGVGVYYCQQPDIKITVTGEIVEDPNTVTVSWTSPTQNTDNSPLTDLAGFKVYYGTSADDLSNTIDINNPLTRSLKIADLTNGYYFAVSAVNSKGVQSNLSSKVFK